MTATYSTLADLIEREILDALNGVEPNFDTDGFVQELRDQDLIVWTGAGFQLIVDEDGMTPGFGALVARFDGEAIDRQIVICEDPAETMSPSLSGVAVGPRWSDAYEAAGEADDFNAMEAMELAQQAGEADYFERWSEAAKAEALKLGYQVRIIWAGSGSPESVNEQTCTPLTPGSEDEETIEVIVWQAAHDVTALPEGWGA